jgi:prepilin-type N-terminal cleavage/methylation domain-containing protein/prepilin-type processing-associated H-X9-DG protein
MTVGLPGTGIGGIFYILLSVYMPLFQLRRSLNGGNKPHHLKMVASAMSLSAVIILSLYGEARLLVWFLEWAATLGGKAPGPVEFGGCTPAMIAPALAAMPLVVLLALIVFIQFARVVLFLSSGQRGSRVSCGPGTDSEAIGTVGIGGRDYVQTNIMKRSGFTLIELLVVISIASFLLAILLPSLQKAREQVNAITCRSNLHQYGLTTLVYLDNNNGIFPAPSYWLFRDPEEPWMGQKCCQWHNAALTPDGLLWSDREPAKIHMCRTFYGLSKRKGHDHPFHDLSIPIKPLYSYSMNAYLGMVTRYGVLKVTQVRRPAKVFIFSEENMWVNPGVSDAVLNDTVLLSRYPPYELADVSDSFGTFHSAKGGDLTTGKANLVFVDGHVDSVHIGADDLDEGFRLAWPKKYLP